MINPLRMYNVEVIILDRNDNAPHVHVKSQTFRIAGLTAPGAKCPLPAGVREQTYRDKLSPNDPFTLDVRTEADPGTSVELVLQKTLD